MRQEFISGTTAGQEPRRRMMWAKCSYPETNEFAPENRAPGKGDSYWKPSFLEVFAVGFKETFQPFSFLPNPAPHSSQHGGFQASEDYFAPVGGPI